MYYSWVSPVEVTDQLFLDCIQWNRFPCSTAMGLKGLCETSVSYVERKSWKSQSTRDCRITKFASSKNLKIMSQAPVITFFFFFFKYKETSGSLFAYWLVNIEFLFSNTQALIVREINLFLNEKPVSLAIAALEKLIFNCKFHNFWGVNWTLLQSNATTEGGPSPCELACSTGYHYWC